MSVDAHIACGTTEAFALTVGYVLPRSWIPPQFRHAEVHHIDGVGIAAAGQTKEEVVYV